MSELAPRDDLRRNEVRQAFSDALTSAIAPLVNESANFDLSLSEVRSLVSEVWFQSTSDKLRKQDLPVTAARLALLGNISRSEAQRWVTIQEERGWGRRKPITAAAIAQLLSLWHSDDRFSGVYGFPIDLARRESKEAKTSFPELVRAVDPGLDPEEMFAFLERAEVLSTLGGKWVRCMRRDYLTEGSLARTIATTGEMLAHHSEAAIYNIVKPVAAKPLFQSEFVTDRPFDEIERDLLRETLKKEGMEMLEAFDTKFKPKTKLEDTTGAMNCGFGIYYFESAGPVLPKDKTKGKKAIRKSGA